MISKILGDSNFNVSIDYCIKLFLADKWENQFLFNTYMISAEILWKNMLLGGALPIDAKNSNFEKILRAFFIEVWEYAL